MRRQRKFKTTIMPAFGTTASLLGIATGIMPITRLTIDRNEASIGKRKISAHCKGKDAGKGRLENIPPGAYGCGEPSAPADIDAHKRRTSRPAPDTSALLRARSNGGSLPPKK